MTTEGDARSPVQDTASIEMHSRNVCVKPALSIEETSPERRPAESSINYGPKPKVSEENDSTSADRSRWQNVDKMLDTNVDVILDNCAAEDRGPDHKPSTGDAQGHMHLSCTSSISDASEDKRKTFDGTRIIDNDYTDLQQDSKNRNTTMSCALEKDALIVLLSETIFKENNLAPEGHRSNNSTTVPTAGLEEKNLTPQDKRSNSTTELSESGHNGDVGCRPNDEKRAFPGACQIVQNASNFKIDDGTNIDDCTTITGSKLQGGGDTENKCAIDLENETAIDHARDNNDSSWHRSNIKETDVKEEKSKALDGTGQKDNASVGLQQDVTKDIRLDDNATLILRSEDSTTAGLEEKNLTPQGKRSNDSSTELFKSEHNSDVGSRPSDEKHAFPGDCQTGQNASNFKIDDCTNTDDYTTITGNKLQGGDDTEIKSAIDLENETSTNHGRDNNNSLCRRSNIKETGVKEEKSKALDGTSPKDKASAGLQQDVTKDIRPGGHATMILTSEDSTTAGLEEKNLTLQSGRDNRSNDSSTKLFKSGGHNSNVGCRTSDDVLAHHEVNNCFPVVCQTGGNAFVDCIGCNQSTNILKIDVGTNTDAYDRIRSKTKKRRNKCRGDNLSIECNPEHNISSCHGKNNNGLNSQNQVPAIEKSPNAFATTSSTNFGQDGNGSVITKLNGHASLGSKMDRGRSSRASKPCNGSKFLRNASNILRKIFCIFKIILFLIIMASLKAQASPVQKQWKQFWFCRMDGPLMNEVLTIKNMKDRSSEDCTFTFTSVPFFKNCSQSGSLVFGKNETCVEMLSEDLTAEDWRIEYGSHRNGDGLPAARGGMLNKKSVKEKIAAYTEPADSSAQLLFAEDNSRTAASRTQKQWQQFLFLKTDGSLINQVLAIKNMKDRSSEACIFTLTSVPFFKNCSQSGSLVFVKNETYVEMLTEDLTAEDWSIEYGSHRNGDGLSAARGERLNEKSVREKIDEYTKPPDYLAQRLSAGYIVGITAGVGALLLLLALLALYKFCKQFKSWVDQVVCRRRSDTNPSDIPLNTTSSTNGNCNGNLPNGESQSETTVQLL